ncbi:hypothetical protein D3C81_194350 [compost metagenome]
MSKINNLSRWQDQKRMIWPGYPVRVLPELLYRVGKLLFDLTQAPFPMIISLLLTALSLAAQGGYDVRGRKNSSPGPVSLYILILASSGERKSSLDKLIMRIFREENRRMQEQYEQDVRHYQVEIELWKTVKKALDGDLKKARAVGKDVQIHNDALRSHLHDKPVEPQKRQILYENSTERALLEGLRGHDISAGLISDEGGSILSNNLFTRPATMNTLWGGRDCYINRMDGNFSIVNPRFTVSLQIQPELWLESPKLTRHFIRESGLISRLLVCHPESTRGTRFEDTVGAPSLDDSADWQQFEALLEKLLREGQKNGGKRIILETLDQEHLAGLCNYIENELNEGYSLNDHNDIGSKIAENTLRLAALFHLCSSEDNQTGISPGCIEDAHDYCTWHINQSLALTAEDAEERRDADLLLKWMNRYFTEPRWYNGFPVSDILVNGPNALRKQGRMKRAMHKIVTMHPGQFLIIDTQGQSPGRSGPQYFVSTCQFDNYWNKP